MLTLRIRAFRKGDYWYAQCLDLNLLARRSTLPEALHALLEQIQLYLATALEKGEWEQRVPRPAPLRDWLNYYLVSLAQEAGRVIHTAMTASTFRYPVDMQGHLIGA